MHQLNDNNIADRDPFFSRPNLMNIFVFLPNSTLENTPGTSFKLLQGGSTSLLKLEKCE